MTFTSRPIGDLVAPCRTWNPSQNTGSFQYIDLSSVDKDLKAISQVEEYSCADAPSRARQLVSCGDVLVATVRPNLNGVALVGELHDGLTASTGYCVLRPKPNLLDPRYLFHWVRTSRFVEAMVKVATGASYPAVSDAKIKESLIPYLPLSEQRRIAMMLDAADALRAKRRESIEQLDSLVQATFLDMFGELVTNPKGWEEVAFGTVVNNSFRNGLSPSTKGTVAGEVLTLTAITTGRFLVEEKKTAYFDRAPADDQTVSQDTFLICRGNGNKRLVGAGAFPDRTDPSICFPDTMIGVTLDSTRMNGEYLQTAWSSSRVRMQLEKAARTTNGTYKVNQQMLAVITLPLPPLTLQARFASFVRAVEQQRALLSAQLVTLEALFTSMQSRAFEGELPQPPASSQGASV